MGSRPEPEVHSAVPQLAPECDLASLPLSPAEGFLLSRVDGSTPWALLRQLGGIPPEEVDRCLRRFAEQGILLVDGIKPGPQATADAAVAPDADLEALLDPSLEIELDQQRAILAFEGSLDRPYHEILEVPIDADARTLRRAYFRLSKEFHPDRYFRKALGPFAERVERVFRKIAEAYELLSDPSARAEMARSQSAEPSQAASPAGSSAPPPHLRGRTTPHAFSLLARIGRGRRSQATRYFASAQQALERENWVDAAAHLRLAIACDPGNPVYTGPFGEVNRKANEIRADRHMREADAHYQIGEYADAYRNYVNALHCRPFDAEANHRAAKLAWRIENDLKAAKEYAARACEVAPDVAAYRKTLGLVYGAAELYLNAQRELEYALRLDGSDAETRQELKTMKRLARRAPLGGA